MAESPMSARTQLLASCLQGAARERAGARQVGPGGRSGSNTTKEKPRLPAQYTRFEQCPGVGDPLVLQEVVNSPGGKEEEGKNKSSRHPRGRQKEEERGG